MVCSGIWGTDLGLSNHNPCNGGATAVKLTSEQVLELAALAYGRGDKPDLSSRDLSDLGLFQARLPEADLSESDLRQVVLTKADLRGAQLEGANLNHADLREADLSGARYNEYTVWSVDFDPAGAGAIRVIAD